MTKAFNKRIVLLRLKSSQGRAEPVEEARAEVGITTRYAALSAGQELSLSVIMWRSEFDGYTHAEYLGKRYKISESGSTANPLHIKLALSRG